MDIKWSSMIKRCFVLFALLWVSVVSMSAQQVSKEAALAKANAFFEKASFFTRGSQHHAPELTLANNRDEFYVFTDKDNGGYVIVSGEERMPDVLAYSYGGSFDADNIPCNMKAWLEGYAEQVKYLRTHLEASATRRTTSERENVGPLLTCRFHQFSPYNNKCPMRCVTGCVATAMAQIMFYWQWPKQTTDAIPGYTTSELKIDMPDIPVKSIDWENILGQYESGKYTEEQADAISTLMLLCGTSTKTDYTPSESSSAETIAAKAFRYYFGYDDLIECVNHFFYNTEDWEQMIYDELSNKRPVLYRGIHATDDVGHVFVLDGYENGYFHVNWGWGGTESYVLMTDAEGWKGYSESQYAVVGIQPAYQDNPSRYAVFDNGKMTLYYDKKKSSRSGTVLPHIDDCPNYKEDITECIIDPSFANLKPKNLSYFFGEWKYLKSIKGLEYLNTSEVTRMHKMFSGCSSLTSLDVSGFRTDKVTDLSSMFYGCKGLTSLDVSGFRTDKVTDMGFMFYGCKGLTSLDVSNFKTDKVTNLNSMFYGCKGLTSLDVSNFKTDNVTRMRDMFYGCEGLTSLDVSNFKTDKVTDMRGMFFRCKGLTSLDVSGFKTDKVTDMGGMFYGCEGLTSLDVSGFKTDNVESMYSMFDGCEGLTSLDVSGFKTDNVTLMSYMFDGCKGLTSLDVSGFKTDNVTSMSYMFYGCKGLTSLDVSGFKTDNVKSMYGMFYGCKGLTSIDVSGFKTDKVTDMRGMFSRCSNISGLTLGNSFTTTEELKCDGLFTGCNNLKTVTFTGDIPSSINSKFFEGVGSASIPAMLEVPEQFKSNYQAKFDGNKFFGGYFTLSGSSAQKIGDLNKDGEVNGTDLVLLVDYILQGNNDEEDADLNGDGQVNGTDLVILVNLIMNDESSNAREAMTRGNDISNTSVSIEPLHIGAGESRKMVISVSNPDMDVTMMQFDMVLPKGLRVNRIGNYMEYELTDRTSSDKHSAYIRDNGDFTRVLIASGTNAILDGAEGGVIRLTLTADDDFEGGNIEFRNMLCTSPDLHEARPHSFTAYIAGNATDIQEINSESTGSAIYNLSGQRLKTTHKGLNIVNGKKMMVK